MKTVEFDTDTTKMSIRGAAEKMMALDDIPGDKCVCVRRPTSRLTPADVVLAPFCAVLMILGHDGQGTLYSSRRLQNLSAALPVEV